MLYTVTFNETERKADIDIDGDVRVGDLLSLTVDGVKDNYKIMTIGGPVIGDVCVQSVIRIKKLMDNDI
ncbi:hypothetical protein V8J03_002098 [Klebsiella pneumoniae]|nr:hypothetical protein [Klebsiella quasipneumoniae subsp. quasipneumoniae]